jgi:hypothetical protein
VSVVNVTDVRMRMHELGVPVRMRMPVAHCGVRVVAVAVMPVMSMGVVMLERLMAVHGRVALA